MAESLGRLKDDISRMLYDHDPDVLFTEDAGKDALGDRHSCGADAEGSAASVAWACAEGDDRGTPQGINGCDGPRLGVGAHVAVLR